MESQTPVPSKTSVPPQPSMSRSRSCSAIAIVNLVLRAISFVLLFMALIILTTASYKVYVDNGYNIDTAKVQFNDFYAYRYTLYTIIIGLVYALLQTALAIFHLASGKLLSSVMIQVDFYADKFISYTLATGAAAAFGMTVDARRVSGASSFWDKTSASASLLFFGFICSAVSSVFSSLALSKNK